MYLGIRLQGMAKDMKTLSQKYQCSGRVSNRGFSEHGAEVIKTRTRRSVSSSS